MSKKEGAFKPKSYGPTCQYFLVMVATYVKAKGTLLVLYLHRKSTSPLLRRTKSKSKETSHHELALLWKCSFNWGHSTTGSESVHLSEVIPNRHDGCGWRKRLGILNWMGRGIPLLGSRILCAQVKSKNSARVCCCSVLLICYWRCLFWWLLILLWGLGGLELLGCPDTENVWYF